MLHSDTEMYVNEMANRFHLDSGNLARKLMELEKEGILKSRHIGGQKHYLLNKSFPLIKEYKKIFKTVGIENTQRNVLSKIEGIQEVVIFGSYAEDKMDRLSDIDLLVVGNHDNIDLQKNIAFPRNLLIEKSI